LSVGCVPTIYSNLIKNEMKHFASFYKVICCLVMLTAVSACQIDKDIVFIEDDVQELVAEDFVCSDDTVTSYLATCVWFMNGSGERHLNGLKTDFSNENIHVYNANGEIVDEGNWEIAQGVLSFNNLSMELAKYVGEWTIIECRDGYIEIQQEELIIGLEKDCQD